MNEVLGILGAGVLFAVFALTSRLGRIAGCGSCDLADHCACAGSAPAPASQKESSDVLDL